MVLQNFLFEHWAEIMMVILIFVVIAQNAKIDRQDEELQKLSYLKSRAEFDTSGVKLEDKFLNHVLVELLKKMTDEQLQSLQAEQARRIKKISNQNFIEHSELEEVDKCKLISSYIAEEMLDRMSK